MPGGNGNIKAINRNGKNTVSSFGKIDELSYFYNGNQLTAVNDNATNTAGTDFNDNGNIYMPSAREEYFYDANGNLTADYNKDITYITYNHQNLPVEIDLRNHKTINYTYTPTGIKLRKEVYYTDGNQKCKF